MNKTNLSILVLILSLLLISCSSDEPINSGTDLYNYDLSLINDKTPVGLFRVYHWNEYKDGPFSTTKILDGGNSWQLHLYDSVGTNTDIVDLLLERDQIYKLSGGYDSLIVIYSKGGQKLTVFDQSTKTLAEYLLIKFPLESACFISEKEILCSDTSGTLATYSLETYEMQILTETGSVVNNVIKCNDIFISNNSDSSIVFHKFKSLTLDFQKVGELKFGTLEFLNLSHLVSTQYNQYSSNLLHMDIVPFKSHLFFINNIGIYHTKTINANDIVITQSSDSVWSFTGVDELKKISIE